MMNTILGILIRHGLSAAGAILVSKGLIATSMIEPVSGAVLLLGSVALSMWQKHKTGTLVGPQ